MTGSPVRQGEQHQQQRARGRLVSARGLLHRSRTGHKRRRDIYEVPSTPQVRRRANISPEGAAFTDNHKKPATKEPDSGAAITGDHEKPVTEQLPSGPANAESEDELASGTPPRRLSVLMSQQQRQQLPSGHYSTTEIRRPQHRSKYYSHSTTEVAWLGQKADRQTVLSHVGRIEELDDGVVASQACDRCREKDLICRCYSDVARTKYQAAGFGYGCARCRFDGKTCSIQVAARAAGGATKPQRENMSSLREEIARQKTRILELELELAWSQRY